MSRSSFVNNLHLDFREKFTRPRTMYPQLANENNTNGVNDCSEKNIYKRIAYRSGVFVVVNLLRFNFTVKVCLDSRKGAKRKGEPTTLICFGMKSKPLLCQARIFFSFLAFSNE